ncbi:MAG: hypothetical protein FWD68_08485 [Alphaproteobacteria bacterium]|nr:hypothetical protein [Alphaproteobacteria bacterium]
MLNLDTPNAEIDAAAARFERTKTRAARAFGYGGTAEALHIAQGCHERLAEALEAILDQPRHHGNEGTNAKALAVLKTIPPHVCALVALNCALRGVVEEESYVAICERAGELARNEAFARELTAHDPQLAEKIEKWVREKHGNLKHRVQSAKSLARINGFSPTARWSPSQLIAVGNLLIDALQATLPDLFEVYYDGDTQMLGVTAGAAQLAQEALQQHIRQYPVFLPSEEPPVAWTAFDKGGPVDPTARRLAVLVRTRHKASVRAIKDAVASGQMKPALDAVNAIQATPWVINTLVMDAMLACQRMGIPVDGLPAGDDLTLPTVTDEVWVTMDGEAKRAYRIARAECRAENRLMTRERMRFHEDMTTAEALCALDQFYIPHNLDWRGREYPMCNFNFQREDRVRALFLFRDGEPIGEEGIAWLKVHTANCGDFGKISKASYDDRIKWVDDNTELLARCARDPLSERFWTGADKPFLFLAACIALTEALEQGPDYVCHLPCSWDGSCSGLQHLCMMTRSEDGAYVNLTDAPQPDDVYQRVADAARKAIEASDDPLASLVLSYGGDWRKLFKRNVMTTFYGSKQFGMAQQHMDDLMEPLRREVLLKKRSEHPFGGTYKEHHAASRFLASHAVQAISAMADLPMKAMQMLQGLAGILADEGKPLEWTTPTGLPWVNRYHEPVTERVRLWMHDHGVRRFYTPLVANGHQPEIAKARAVNGSAPNFVHACDGAHLLLTVNAAVAEGIEQFALVHDSFGTLPSHAARFQGIIRETLVDMYEQHDVLTEVLQRATCALKERNSKLTALTELRDTLHGNLNIKEVINAAYAFA